MDRRLALLCSLVLCAPRGAVAQSPPILTAAQLGFLHKFNVGGSGPPGYCIEYIQALRRHDPGLEFSGLDQLLPTARIERDLSAGRIEVFFGMLRTPEREARFRFADGPRLYTVHQQVAALASDLEAEQVRDFNGLRALTGTVPILATRASGYTQFLRGEVGLNVDEGGFSVNQNLHKLLNGRARFLYDSEASLRQAIEAEGLQSRVRILPPVFRHQDLLLAYTPALAPDRLARILAAMNAVEAAGEAARLRAAYSLR